MRNEKAIIWILSTVFMFIGLAVIALGIYLFVDNRAFMEGAEKTEAIITQIDTRQDSDGDEHHTVYVEFEVDGRSYSGDLGFYTSSMRRGKAVTVYYDPDDPGYFRGSGSSFLGIFVSAFGLVFILIGGGIIFAMLLKKKRAKRLLETGRRVDATIDCVRYNRSYTVNGRHPYVLDLTYVDPATGKYYTFTSENIWFNVEAVLQTTSIATLSVYIDEQNSRRYYVDIEPLTSLLAN